MTASFTLPGTAAVATWLQHAAPPRMEVGMRRLCVFCGSSVGGNAKHTDGARRFCEALVARGLGLVYVAGHVGLMGVLADAVLSAGGEVIGVIPQALVDRDLA